MHNDAPFRRALQDFAERLPQAVDETPFTLFVCGPSAERKCRGTSANLRRYVSTRIAEQMKSVTVVWGEHRHFRGRYGMVELKRFNDLNREIAFASDYADLIVVFPDSPGSFAELGCFGVNDKICPRLIVIFDKKRRNAKGFVVQAVRHAAESRRAMTKFMDYRDRESVLEFLTDTVRSGQENLHIRKKYGAG